jgi:hypothetical protein
MFASRPASAGEGVLAAVANGGQVQRHDDGDHAPPSRVASVGRVRRRARLVVRQWEPRDGDDPLRVLAVSPPASEAL